MAKWYGKIGFAEMVETKPGVWKEQITERNYYGDLTRISRQLQTTDQVNDDINIANELSIVADAFANGHFHTMRYAEFSGVRWKVSRVEVKHPRLILSLGGVYNGKQA